jgi:hypothetical protein
MLQYIFHLSTLAAVVINPQVELCHKTLIQKSIDEHLPGIPPLLIMNLTSYVFFQSLQ